MLTKYKYVISLAIIIHLTSCAQNNILKKAIENDPTLKEIATNPDYEVQVIYTRIDKKRKRFMSYKYQVDTAKYFYPASTVKMPVAILALQKINELNAQGINISKDDIMMTAGLNEDLKAAYIDTTNTHGKPTISRYIEKIFAVSDNDAYNRLYEFLGQDYINESLRSNGTFRQSVINHRLGIANLSKKENQQANNVRFFRNNKVIYDKEESISQKEWLHHAKDALKGVGYLNRKDSLINHPFDFRFKNFYTLEDMELTLQKIVFPTYFNMQERFHLDEKDYEFLKKCMSELPKFYKFYDPKTYFETYVKFLMYGSDPSISIPDDIKIYNKVGNAYGYLIDCAYIEDVRNNISFFLSAVIHVNNNKIYNDGKYEYDEIGLPFLKQLGQRVYELELKNRK